MGVQVRTEPREAIPNGWVEAFANNEYRSVAWIYSKWFDIPFYTFVPYMAERLELETDFINEAKNSETMRALVQNERSMRGRVYVPATYPELSSRRVMTAEWIEGVRLWDKKTLTARWVGGRGKGTPGARAPLPPVDMEALRREVRTQAHAGEQLKPARQEWKGRRGRGGLGLSTSEVMGTVVDLFSAQIFKWGVVHCDPHPGNVFVRRLPSGRAEVVLIDHGLYVYMTPEFRRQYAEFWKALMTFDNDGIARVTKEWGINAPDLFASATLMRPYEGGSQATKDTLLDVADDQMSAARHHEMEKKMKQGLKDLLADEDKWPKELLFIGRNMRIVQANNQYMGSPVNRIKIMGLWASRSLFEDRGMGFAARMRNMYRHFLFRLVMTASDVAFYALKVGQWLGLGGGMEDVMEKRMKGMASDFGIELQNDVFDG